MPDHSTPQHDPAADLLDISAAYALHAVDDAERQAIEQAVAAAEPSTRAEFDSLVRGYREAMAAQSAATALAPPAHVLDAVLAAVQSPAVQKPAASPPADKPADRPAAEPISLADARRHRRNGWVAGLSAAAAVVAITFAGITVAQRPGDTGPPVSAQVLAAPDVRTSATPIPGGGTATIVFSKDVNAAVLVMNDVTPPAPGTVYQIWLTGPDQVPVSRGTMDPDMVTPSTQALVTGIDSSTALSFSLEPPGGSEQPTEVFASIPLT